MPQRTFRGPSVRAARRGDSMRPTGALKDKRKPDDQVRFYVPRAAYVPVKGDWSPFNPWPFDQDGRGMCVGVADCELMANDAARLGIIPANYPLFYSPWYIYNRARHMRGWLNDDNGCYPEDAAQSIVEHGVLRYDSWPCERDEYGNIAMDKTDPTIWEMAASRYPGVGKARIDNGVKGLLAALNDGVVSLAVPWFDKWGSSYKSGVLPPINTETSDTRHNVLLDGWNEDEGMFYGLNSWGEWGIRESALGERSMRCGFKMPFEYIETIKSKFGGYDAWDIDFDYAPPEKPLQFGLNVSAGPGGHGSGVYEAMSQAEIYAGARDGYTFSAWRPERNIAAPGSARTTITVREPDTVTAYFKQEKKQRCGMFLLAQILNKLEGIS